MKAVILAAGIASRLRPLTNDSPKCLLKIGKKCLLERTLDALIVNGINEFIIVTGYLKEKIEEFVRTNYPNLNVEFIFNEFYETTNNIYSLWLTKPSVESYDIILLDSDILFEASVITLLLKSEYKNCLALNAHELGDEEMKVVTDSTGKIIDISKTCSIVDAVGESIGIEKMSKNFISKLFDEMDEMIQTKNQSNIFYEAAFQNIIQKGAKIYAVDTTSLFSMELDTVEDFETACERNPFE